LDILKSKTMKTETINDVKWIGKQILGTWELLKWIYEDENGHEVAYFDEKPKGLLMYMPSGLMSVQVSKPQRKSFSSKGFDSGTESEQAEAFRSYIAYYGKYKEISPALFEHHLERSLFPNWEGDVQTREAKLDGNLLELSTPSLPTKNGNIIFRLTWRKIY